MTKRMKKNKIIKLLTYMNFNYSGRFKFPRKSEHETNMMVEVWYDLLKYYNYELIDKALKKLIIESPKWPPSAGEIVREVEIMTRAPEDKLTAGEAWRLAVNSVRKYGYYRPIEGLNSLPEQVRKTVEHFGGFRRLCHADISSGYARSQFMKLYKEVKRKKEKLIYLPDKFKDEILKITEGR